MTRRARDNAAYPAIAVLAALLVAAGAFGARFALAGGDLGCTLSTDPTLCAAVKEVAS